MYAIHSAPIYKAFKLNNPKKQTKKWKDPIKLYEFVIRGYPLPVHPKTGESEAIAAGG